MGILGKVIGAGASLIGAGAEALGKGIENAFLKQEKKNLEQLEKYPYKHRFIVREVKDIQSDMAFAAERGLKKNFFVVYSVDNVPVYYAYSEEKFGKCKYTLVDMTAKQLAILVAKKKSCSLECQDFNYELKFSDLFDNIKYSLANSDYKVSCNATGKEIKFQTRGSSKPVIQINKVPSDLGAKWGEYIIGCNNEKDILLTMMLGIATGTILMQSANLLAGD